jgi:CHAT domain-containing protein
MLRRRSLIPEYKIQAAHQKTSTQTSGRKMSTINRIVGSSLIIGAATLAIAFLWPEKPTLREELLAMSGSCRPTPGRMTGEKTYRPWHAVTCDNLSSTELKFLKRAAHSRWREQTQHSPLDIALLDILSGKTTQAIANLELASRESEMAIPALIDLSAAYLLRFEIENDPLDLLRAIGIAEQGLTRDPEQPDLLFNRAQALSRLGTRRLAIEAWQDNLERAASLDWRNEMLAYMRELRKPTDEDRWTLDLQTIESTTATPEQVMALVLRLPGNARSYGEETLLPRWATEILRGDNQRAEHSLKLATIIGQGLAQKRGETLLSDSISIIHRVMENGSTTQRDYLLQGLYYFGIGVIQYQDQNLESAREPLLRAIGDLHAVDCPLSLWARFYLAIGEYYDNSTRGLALFDALLTEIPQNRYLALAGRIEWLAGTADKIQGRIQSSVRRYKRSKVMLQRAGGEPTAAFVSVLLAESYELLGEHSLGWKERILAFRRVPLTEGPRRNIAMWGEAKEALLRCGHLDMAGPLVGEAVKAADRWGHPLGRVTAYVNRATYWLEIGRKKQAMRDLREAKNALSHMEESGLKKQMVSITSITEGLYYQQFDPSKSAALLQAALKEQVATGNRFEAITYTTEKAKSQLAADDLASGAASLEEAISLFEDIRATVEDPASRIQAFRQAQPAFDKLLEIRSNGIAENPEEVFLLAERSRARVLLELRPGNVPPAGNERDFASLSSLEKKLPPKTTFVSYVVLEDRVLAWVVETGHFRFLKLNIERRNLEHAIETFRLEMSRKSDESDLRASGASLYDSLIRPLALGSESDESLIIAPDRWLARLPFAPLFDREKGQYLIEQRAVTMVPSATLLLRRSEDSRSREQRELSALTVGVYQPGSYAGKNLLSLPHAEEEAKKISQIYKNSRALLGSEATKENFLRLSVSTAVVHFAGHAVVDLELPGRSALLFASPAGDLEPLLLGDVFETELGGASLVVLSACRAQDSLAEDREELLGVAGAFFAAGVPEVVASPWDVEDRSSMHVMVAFHREYKRHRSAGIAFRQAVLGMMRSGSLEERSPATWGAFTVIAGFSRNGSPRR